METTITIADGRKGSQKFLLVCTRGALVLLLASDWFMEKNSLAGTGEDNHRIRFHCECRIVYITQSRPSKSNSSNSINHFTVVILWFLSLPWFAVDTKVFCVTIILQLCFIVPLALLLSSVASFYPSVYICAIALYVHIVLLINDKSEIWHLKIDFF